MKGVRSNIQMADNSIFESQEIQKLRRQSNWEVEAYLGERLFAAGVGAFVRLFLIVHSLMLLKTRVLSECRLAMDTIIAW